MEIPSGSVLKMFFALFKACVTYFIYMLLKKKKKGVYYRGEKLLINFIPGRILINWYNYILFFTDLFSLSIICSGKYL